MVSDTPRQVCCLKLPMMRRVWIKLLIIGLCCLATGPSANALAAAGTPAPDLSRGAFYGKVVDTVSGQPVAGATVALQDKSGKVVAWTTTGGGGEYVIAADALPLLQLRPSPRRRGLLSNVMHGVGFVVTAPVKVAAGAVGFAGNMVKSLDPVKTAKATAASAVSGNPAPLVWQVRDTAARVVLSERQSSPRSSSDLLPGELRIAVSAPLYKHVKGKAGAYWLEPPAQREQQTIGIQVWLETVKMAPVQSDKESEVANMALLLAEPRLDPILAPQGATVNLSVKLQAPADKTPAVRVFAREDKTRTVVELIAQGDNLFAGKLALDPATPVGDTVVTIVALRAEPIEVSPRGKTAALIDFARQLDDLDADKPYGFDPRIMASENRLDLALTILDLKQATPPAQ